jgi:hypothetical protein
LEQCRRRIASTRRSPEVSRTLPAWRERKANARARALGIAIAAPFCASLSNEARASDAVAVATKDCGTLDGEDVARVLKLEHSSIRWHLPGA